MKPSLIAVLRLSVGATARIVRTMLTVIPTVLVVVLAQDFLDVLLRQMPPWPLLMLGRIVDLAAWLFG